MHARTDGVGEWNPSLDGPSSPLQDRSPSSPSLGFSPELIGKAIVGPRKTAWSWSWSPPRSGLVVSASNEGMTNGPSIFAYLVFGPGRTSTEWITRPTKITAWRGPGARLVVQGEDSKGQT
jgi:hypothetical protein